jgi:hypothetical protein
MARQALAFRTRKDSATARRLDAAAGRQTPTTFRTWSALETVISVVGLALVFALSHLL